MDPARSDPGPVRPPLSDAIPAPLAPKAPPPAVLVVAQSLWIASLAAGAAAVILAFIHRTDEIDGVRSTIVDLEFDATTETVDTVSYLVFLVSILAILVVAVVEYLVMRRMMSGHGGARWVLVGLLVVHAAAFALAGAFVTFGEMGVLISGLLLSWTALAVLGLCASFLPGSKSWFQQRKVKHLEAGRA